MKNMYWIIPAIIVMLLVSGLVYFGPRTITPSKEILEKYPALRQNYEINSINFNESMIINGSSIEYINGSFYCDGLIAKSILVSSQKQAVWDYRSGGWGSTSIVDCGKYYFVRYTGDAGPLKLYGPFFLNH